MTTPYQQLVERLRSPIGILNDCNSLIWVRFHPNSDLYDKREAPLGGGNFLILLGLFSIINLYAKAYYILLQGFPIDDQEAVKRAKEKFKQLQSEHSELELLRIVEPRKKHLLPEKDCFVELILALQSSPVGQYLGLPPDKGGIKRAWQDIRNALAHYGSIAGNNAAAVLIPDAPQDTYERITNALLSNDTSYIHQITGGCFYIENGYYTCNGDLLQYKVREILKWLVDKVNGREFNVQNVRECIYYLNEGLQLNNEPSWVVDNNGTSTERLI